MRLVVLPHLIPRVACPVGVPHDRSIKTAFLKHTKDLIFPVAGMNDAILEIFWSKLFVFHGRSLDTCNRLPACHGWKGSVLNWVPSYDGDYIPVSLYICFLSVKISLSYGVRQGMYSGLIDLYSTLAIPPSHFVRNLIAIFNSQLAMLDQSKTLPTIIFPHQTDFSIQKHPRVYSFLAGPNYKK